MEAGNRLRGSSKVQVRDARGLQEKWPDGGCTLKAELTGGAGGVTWNTKEGRESKTPRLRPEPDLCTEVRELVWAGGLSDLPPEGQWSPPELS